MNLLIVFESRIDLKFKKTLDNFCVIHKKNYTKFYYSLATLK